MAFTPSLKQVDQVKVQITPFLKITEIVAPHEEWKVAGHLPPLRTDTMNEEPFVVEGGDIVAISARTEARFVNRVTIANGGSSQDITYTAADVAAGVEDPATPGQLRTAATLVSGARPANFPIGFAPWPYYRGILEDIYINFELQPFVAVWNQGYLEYPMLLTAQTDGGANALVRGRLCQSDANGKLILWDNATDDVEQIVGRVWAIRTIADEVPKRGLDKVHVVPGIGLSGADSGGVPRHLDQLHQNASKATLMYRVVIDAAV